MRLGDLDALKEQFIEGAYTTKGIREVIDNAPTVEIATKLQQNCNQIATKGEWIYGEDDCGQDGWFCSECNFFVPWYYQYYGKDVDFIRDYKGCPHCLAEMITYIGKDRDAKGGDGE